MSFRSDPVSLTENWKRSQRAFTLVVYVGGVVALIVATTALILKNAYSAADNALFSEASDAVLFELALLLGGAAFGSAVVGALFQQYQRRFVERDRQLAQQLVGEGIIGVFASAQDPRLVDFLVERVSAAKSEITFLGLGLGILAHNHQLLRAICDRINNQSNLVLRVITGTKSTPGVNIRIKAEKKWHVGANLSYDPTWVTRYPAEIRTHLESGVDEEARSRISIEEADWCPTVTICKIDDYALFFAYGSPNVRGSRSPCARRRVDPSLLSASVSSPERWVRSVAPPGANHRCSSRGVGRGRPKWCLRAPKAGATWRSRSDLGVA